MTAPKRPARVIKAGSMKIAGIIDLIAAVVCLVVYNVVIGLRAEAMRQREAERRR